MSQQTSTLDAMPLRPLPLHQAAQQANRAAGELGDAFYYGHHADHREAMVQSLTYAERALESALNATRDALAVTGRYQG